MLFIADVMRMSCHRIPPASLDEQGHDEVVAYLLEAKADATVVNDDKESAVALAAKHGHEGIVVSLLNAGVRERKSTPVCW